MDWFMFGMGDLIENWSRILHGTIPNPEGHNLRIFI